MYIQSLAAIFLSLGLMVSTIHADTLEFASPRPDTKVSTGQVVPFTYKVHHNGMAKLLWAKVHLMTEDGKDAGIGTISTTARSEWQDSLSVSSRFKIPENLAPGKYTLHVYGSTEQPCEGSVDFRALRRYSLGNTPVEIKKTSHTTPSKDPKKPKDVEKDHSLVGIQLGKRGLYAKRNIGMHGQSEFLLQDGSVDTKKMLYFFSLI
ncbi:hypothetical protein BGX26_009061 [Mortierella sp. AD094]|nr:hypothetical protein BGX26_009061 [Mortierella sp. AD094]